MTSFKWYSDNDPKLNVNCSNDVVYLTSPLLENVSWLNHGISTRLGGVSEGFCSSMNFAYNGYDDPDKVARNYELFSNATGININKIVTPKQVHGTNVVKVTSDHVFRNVKTPGCDFPGVDGMITDVAGVTLFSFSADCSLIMICDPVHKAIGQCHAGWRGMAGRISAKTISMMSENYGSNPEDLLVTISPSICPECFEVEWDMVSEAIKDFKPEDYKDIYYQRNESKYQFNLWEANKKVLLEAGVPAAQIFMPNLCTKCNPDTLFSHRNYGLKRGTLISFMQINE